MTTFFLARRHAPDDLHPRSGELAVLVEDLRRISFDVGTRLSACNCNRGTDKRERQRGTHEDQRFMIVPPDAFNGRCPRPYIIHCLISRFQVAEAGNRGLTG